MVASDDGLVSFHEDCILTRYMHVHSLECLLLPPVTCGIILVPIHANQVSNRHIYRLSIHVVRSALTFLSCLCSWTGLCLQWWLFPLYAFHFYCFIGVKVDTINQNPRRTRHFSNLFLDLCNFWKNSFVMNFYVKIFWINHHFVLRFSIIVLGQVAKQVRLMDYQCWFACLWRLWKCMCTSLSLLMVFGYLACR